ncbi:EAL domain-containing protein [Sulfuricystis thermophila]|uniref:EAL domain-containing protein n=1 Tax=Sulfuricystis thermophila TaxID=2496847 RepID=UPI001035552C|nr:EAL domain-containing protein [Sulfuricystis thermophila]
MNPSSVNPRMLADVDRRLSLAFGGLIFGLMVLVLIAGGLYLRGVMEREEDKLSTLVTQVLANAVSRVSFSGKYHARLLLEEIRAAQPSILYLRLVDPQGTVLAHSNPAYNDSQLDAAALAAARTVFTDAVPRTVRHLVLDGEPLREVSLPYRGGYDDAIVGVIQVGLSERERNEAIADGVLYILLLVFFLMLLGIVATRRISAALAGPVRRQLLLAASVFDASREGILITDREQRILRVNAAFTRLTGYTEAELLGMTPKLLQSGHHDPEFYTALWRDLKRHGQWQGEVLDRRRDGQIIPVLLSISVVKDAGGDVLHYVALHTDISRIKESEARLEYQARHDHLTGLANRLMLHLRLEHALSRARRENTHLALLMLDLDRFKDVNDSFGHLMGDALLRQVAERLIGRVRSADTVSRLGGDEFTVLLENIENPAEAARVADDLIRELSEPFCLPNGNEVVVGATVGIAIYPEHGASEEALLQGADAALYQAKSEGRGRYRFFSDALTQAARERIELEARLRRAVAQGELLLHFQPQYDIVSGALVGAEALVRWQSPEEGLVPPGRFIPVAEQSGLIEAIGDWVLAETCRQGQRWNQAGLPALTLAVNVSSRQFQRSDFVDRLANILEETGFPSQRLELELTESTLMEHGAQVLETLGRLRALGIRIAIDDFGTGYSSLAYLKRLPIDVLKIDKSFVDDIPRLSDDMEITATIIAMAHALRLKVLAEGVETHAQLDFLRERGCDFYQGFLMSRPLPVDAFTRLLDRQRVS